MKTLEVSLFGKFHVETHGQSVVGLEARKVQELFSYLLLHSSRSHSREALAELLWGNRMNGQSRKYLRQALWQIQSALQPYLDNGSHIFLAEADWVQYNARCEFWIDVAAFEQTFSQSRAVAGAALDRVAAEELHKAAQLYQGDLLEGCYEDWCIFERERLQTMYLAMLDKLMDYCEAHHEFEMGLGYGETILRYDLAREHTHRRIMRLYYLSGRRTEALRQYDRCLAALAQELAVKPSKRTQALCDQIRADSSDAPRVSAEPGGTARPNGAMLNGSGANSVELEAVLRRLEIVQAVLADIQHQLDRDVQMVRQAVADSHLQGPCD